MSRVGHGAGVAAGQATPPSIAFVGMGLASVLVVEDDEGIGRSLAQTLAVQGHEVAWARGGKEALEAIGPSTALVLLDLWLPDVDGLLVCRHVRERFPDTQVLILTVRDQEADVVLGLDAGADDYLVKPFRLAELLARVRACLRRRAGGDHWEIGDLVVDEPSRTARVRGRTVEFRPKEFDLLTALARDAGRVVSRERLMAEVWDEQRSQPTKTLDIHISGLRRKLDEPGTRSCISTVRGLGYRLESP